MGQLDRLGDDVMGRTGCAPPPSPILPPAARPAGVRLLLVEELTAGLDAAAAFERLAGLPYVLFLDSALQDPVLGRFSFLTADPFDLLCSRGRRVWTTAPRSDLEPADPFAVLADRLARFRAEPV